MKQTSSNVLYDAFMQLTPLIGLSFILGVLIFGIAIAYVIRLWLVQTATFQIQRDLADIKELLASNRGLEREVSETHRATEENEEGPIPALKKIAFRRPRKLFIWVSIAIPVLLIVLIIIINLL